MVYKKLMLCLFFALADCHWALGQEGIFCDAVKTIMRDAPNKFRNIKGKSLGDSYQAITWACGITIPGTINSRFVSSMGLFYEGAFLQTTEKSELKAVYDKYVDALAACLTPLGYTISRSSNFYTGLEDYKKVAFMPELKSDSKEVAPPHVAIEATYSKDVGKYTLVMYIFEH